MAPSYQFAIKSSKFSSLPALVSIVCKCFSQIGGNTQIYLNSEAARLDFMWLYRNNQICISVSPGTDQGDTFQMEMSQVGFSAYYSQKKVWD